MIIADFFSLTSGLLTLWVLLLIGVAALTYVRAKRGALNMRQPFIFTTAVLSLLWCSFIALLISLFLWALFALLHY